MKQKTSSPTQSISILLRNLVEDILKVAGEILKKVKDKIKPNAGKGITARYIACADSAFLTLTTWDIVDATSLLDSTAGNTALTTSYVGSSAFTPGAIVIDALALKIAALTGTTGTMSASLSGPTSGTADAAVTTNNTSLTDTRLTLASRDWVGGVITCNGKTMTITSISGTNTFVGSAWSGGGNPGNGFAWSIANGIVPGTEVVINTADICDCTTTFLGGWILFKLAAPVTLVAATAYKVQARTSSASMVTLYRDGTAGNWSRMLRTTTNPGALSAADIFDILEEKTSAGAATTRTVTMNNTDTTVWGAINISDGGTLTYGNSAATNYYLKMAGDLSVFSNGNLLIGDTGAGAIPRDSTAVLEFDCASDNQYGLMIYGSATVKAQGLSRTSGKVVTMCFLNTDEAVGQTTLGVDADTGWLSGDEVVIASTTRTFSQAEKRTLDGNAGASSFAVTVGLTNAHSGTSPTAAEVGLLTRNVAIRSDTSGIMCKFTMTLNAATLDFDWVSLYEVGNGLNFNQISGAVAVDFQYCSIYNVEGLGVFIQHPVPSGGSVSIKNNIIYNFFSAAASSTTRAASINAPAAAGGVLNFEDNMLCLGKFGTQDTSYTGLEIILEPTDPGANFTFKNNYISSLNGLASAVSVRFLHTASEISVLTSDVSGNSIHSNQGAGLAINKFMEDSVINGSTVWRNGGMGLIISGDDINGYMVNTTVKDFVLFGNTTANLCVGSMLLKNVTLDNISGAGDSDFSVASGILFDNFANTNPLSQMLFVSDLYITNSDFGVATGIKVAHTTADLTFAALTTGLKGFYGIYLFNTTLASATEISGFPSTAADGHFPDSFIRTQFMDAGVNSKSYFYAGTIEAQSVIRDGVSGTAPQLTPNSATLKLILPGPNKKDTFKGAVLADAAVTITARVYKDASYNGNAPRLVLVGGIVPGIASDVVDSLSVAAETWETLSVSGTPDEDCTVEFYVDCDGTAGTVVVDNITISQA